MIPTPDQIAQLVSTYGFGTAAGIIVIIAYITRPKKAEPAENPANQIVEKLDGISAKQDALIAKAIRIETILEERK